MNIAAIVIDGITIEGRHFLRDSVYFDLEEGTVSLTLAIDEGITIIMDRKATDSGDEQPEPQPEPARPEPEPVNAEVIDVLLIATTTERASEMLENQVEEGQFVRIWIEEEAADPEDFTPPLTQFVRGMKPLQVMIDEEFDVDSMQQVIDVVNPIMQGGHR